MGQGGREACSINTNVKDHFPLKSAWIEVTPLHLSRLCSACFGADLKINVGISWLGGYRSWNMGRAEPAWAEPA